MPIARIRSRRSEGALAVLSIWLCAACRNDPGRPSPTDAGARGPTASESASSKHAASTRDLAQTVAGALLKGDAEPIAALLAKEEPDVRVEVRQSLVETDERSAETWRSAGAARSWLARERPRWSCGGDDCAWPGGLVTGDLARCAGDCCSSDYPAGLQKKTLYLSRVCFAAREGSRARLSYIGLVEAK